jgi:hypothetical protein
MDDMEVIKNLLMKELEKLHKDNTSESLAKRNLLLEVFKKSADVSFPIENIPTNYIIKRQNDSTVLDVKTPDDLMTYNSIVTFYLYSKMKIHSDKFFIEVTPSIDEGVYIETDDDGKYILTKESEPSVTSTARPEVSAENQGGSSSFSSYSGLSGGFQTGGQDIEQDIEMDYITDLVDSIGNMSVDTSTKSQLLKLLTQLILEGCIDTFGYVNNELTFEGADGDNDLMEALSTYVSEYNLNINGKTYKLSSDKGKNRFEVSGLGEIKICTIM